MRTLPIAFGLLLLFVTAPQAAFAQDEIFAIIIGNNAVPADGDHHLAPLRYADDDAVRYYNFFVSMTGPENVRLLTVPDSRTQKKYPGVASRAVEPSLSNLFAAVQYTKDRIDKSRKRGKKASVFVVFSGHGAMDGLSVPFLAMTDGPLTGRLLYDEIFPLLNSSYQHLIVDACHAEGVAAPRGMFDKEYTSEQVVVSERDRSRLDSAALQRHHSGLGLIIASSEYEESHEWSRIESGVFTHEILSGLAGPADVNLDGKIEYSELSAFIAAANRGVNDLRGRVNVIAKAPLRNVNVPIVDYTRRGDRSFLYGDASKLSHFYIELENGERYLDANLSDMHAAYVVLPNRTSAFVRTSSKEAFLDGNATQNLTFDTLRFVPLEVSARGGIASSLRAGLFHFPFGVPYYLGHVDSVDVNSVDMNAARLSFDPKPPLADDAPSTVADRLKIFSFSFYALGGASLAAAGVLGALSLKAKSDYRRTTVERDSDDYNTTYSRLGTAFWATAATVPVFVALGAVFQIKARRGMPMITLNTNTKSALHLRLSVDF